jgi:hypothetical protein
MMEKSLCVSTVSFRVKIVNQHFVTPVLLMIKTLVHDVEKETLILFQNSKKVHTHKIKGFAL